MFTNYVFCFVDKVSNATMCNKNLAKLQNELKLKGLDTLGTGVTQKGTENLDREQNVDDPSMEFSSNYRF